MSVAHLSSFKLQDQDVLGELLHSLSQPLTSLRCSLELSFDEVAVQQQAAVGIALQQTERVIGMIQLMREYLDAEQPGPDTARRIPLDSVLREVIGDMDSLAEVRGVELHLEGACSATVSLDEPRLRLALQYLVSALIEGAGTGERVLLRLEEGSTESALRAGVRGIPRAGEVNLPVPHRRSTSIHETLRMVRLAIAQRVLETGGTLLTIEAGDRPGFVLRIPRMLAASRAVV
jgi:signal transduction histidine kinase